MLRIKLGHGGLANASDFAVFEVRNYGQRPCAMRLPVAIAALDQNGRRSQGIPVLRSAPARPPIVLAAPSKKTHPLVASQIKQLGILISGGTAIGMGGCPAARILRPWAWRLSIDGHALTLRNRTRSVATSLIACRLRDQGFGVSRQTPSDQLPVREH